MDQQSAYIPPHLRGQQFIVTPNGAIPAYQPQQQQQQHTYTPQQHQHQHQHHQGGHVNGNNAFAQRPQPGGGFAANFGQAFHPQQHQGHHNNSHHRGGYQQNNHRGGFGGYNGGGNRYGAFNAQQDEQEVLSLFDTTGVSKGINFAEYDNIPVSLHPDNRVSPIKAFQDVAIPQELIDNIARCKYDAPTPVQKHTIPIALNNFDLMACAQTGSGKTAAFLLPVIIKILGQPRQTAPTYGVIYPQCVVMAPTRELAGQIYAEARKFCFRTRLRPAVLYGGVDIRGQLNQLSHGGDLVIATPGRLWDVFERGNIRFQNVKCLVLDEADRMLDMGFEPQIRQIVQSRDTDMPNRDGRQTLMFSATFPREIQNLAHEFLSRNYLHLTVGRIGSTTQNIIQSLWKIDEFQKIGALTEALQTHAETDLTLVFAETRRSVEDITRRLVRSGYPAVSIHGDKSQAERETALSAFKTARKPILVATDVASRGLDIPNVMCVIQYDLPHHIDEYVHRIGRTGRCGNEGDAISFFSQKNAPMARELIDILTESNQEVPEFLYEAVNLTAFQQQQKKSARGRGGGGRGGMFGGRGGGFGGGYGAPYNNNRGGAFFGHNNAYRGGGGGGAHYTHQSGGYGYQAQPNYDMGVAGGAPLFQ
eukprot:PhM_4_TR433/c2_g1_i1/m.20120/K11594/DDX3X, bel; ATP-dependent RNA helicase DDX3X